MKKIIAFVMCLSVFLTTGCGTIPTLSNGDEIVVKLDKDLSISVNTIYEKLKDTYGSAMVIDMIDTLILDKEYPTDDKILEAVSNQIAYVKEQSGEEFLSTIKNYWGVNNEEELTVVLLLTYKRQLLYEDYAQSLITDVEIQKYYDNEVEGDIRASHILIPTNATEEMSEQEKADANEKAKTKAEGIIKQLDDGASFASLANKYSIDEVSAKEGGDLNFFNKGAMDEIFEKAAYALKKGEYTKIPVLTTYGYHIIKKTDQKSKPKLEDSKENILFVLGQKKLEEDKTIQYNALKKIRAKYNMKIVDTNLKKGYDKQMKALLSE